MVDLAEHDVERADLIASNMGTLTTASIAIPAQARDAFLERATRLADGLRKLHAGSICRIMAAWQGETSRGQSSKRHGVSG
ncbi:MAG: hypothetical protein E5Y31_17900 [Mesorhizobium sp.]|nr:MAG: hypothetical protein E5Y31_17900 [Mesorhizobium sp.]